MTTTTFLLFIMMRITVSKSPWRFENNSTKVLTQNFTPQSPLMPDKTTDAGCVTTVQAPEQAQSFFKNENDNNGLAWTALCFCHICE